MKRTALMLLWVLAFLLMVPYGIARAQQSMPAEPETPQKAQREGDPVVVPARAAVPRLVKFAGTLKNEKGEPRRGVVGATFALYDRPEGGAPLWLETHNVELDEEGRYAVLLGSTKRDGIPLELFASGEPRWLAIEPVDGGIVSGRVLLVSVPYALKAADADSLGGRAASEFLTTTHLEAAVRDTVAVQVARELETQTAEKDGGSSPQISEGPSTFSGTNTTEIVLVTQLGTGLALRGTTPGQTALSGQTTHATGRAIFGVATSTGDTRAFGMLGRSDSRQGVGFQGTATSTTGTTIGVQGFAFSTSGTAFSGTATATTGSTIGAYAEVRSADGVAGRFRNTNTAGKLLSGIGASTEVFNVTGAGGGYFAGSVGIGTKEPTELLEVAGTVKASSFIGSGAGLTGIFASGLAAGTYANAVTFSNASNTFAGYFTGEVNASRLTIGDDVPFSSAPRFFVNAHFDGELVAPVWTAAKFIPDKPITVTRVTADLKTAGDSLCTGEAAIRVSDGTKGHDLLVTRGETDLDSGPFAMIFGGGTPVRVQLRDGAMCPGVASPADANVIVHYRMQAPQDTDACPAGHSSCAGICQDLAADTSNCGSCASPCSSDNLATRACAAGACVGTCQEGFADCNSNLRSDGCEINTTNNPDHCSNCGTACSNNNMATRTCGSGVCNGTCNSGFGDCNNNKQTDGCEINTTNNPDHCSACGTACSNNNMATRTCGSGVCDGTCNTGFGDCNSNKQSDGCETNLNTNPDHCSACGLACSSNNMATRTCDSLKCTGTCASGFVDCNNNKQSDGCETQLSGSSNTSGTAEFLGSFAGDTHAGAFCPSAGCVNQATATRSGLQGRFFSVTAREDSTCDAEVRVKFSLSVSTELNYLLFVTNLPSGCSCSPSCSSGTGATGLASIVAICPDTFGDNTFTPTVEVRYFSGSVCSSWSLVIRTGNCT